jgi:hypothetical protein
MPRNPSDDEPNKVPPRPGRPGVPKRPSGKAVPPASRPPSRSAANRTAANRQSARQAVQARQRNRNIGIASAAVVAVIAVVVVLIVAKQNGAANKTIKSVASEFALPTGVLTQVENVPVSALVQAAETDTAGATTPKATPAGTATLTANGLPEVLYVGAEYCPYCAAERWAMVMALSKVGTFTNLQGTTSSQVDVNPNTPTFAFYGSTFTSPYVSFVPVEEETNAPITDSSGNVTGYGSLQNPTSEQNALVTKWDVSPYTTQNGSIPFVYFAGKYIQAGAQYDASALSGQQMTQAAAYVTSGTNATSKAAEAAAGHFLAAVCSIANDKPPVCASVPSSLITGKSGSKGSSTASTTPSTSSAPSTTKASS